MFKVAKAIIAAIILVPVAAVLPARAIEIERVVSEKGIEAWLVQEDSIPVIAMSFAFIGGTSQDPVETAGVANMLSALLDEGAGDLDSEAFQLALDDAAIGLSFSAGRDTFRGSLRTLAANRDEAVRLLHLALTEPRFDEEPVERIRSQILVGLQAEENDPADMASRALMPALFPDHPYGQPSDGTIESVSAITREDLRTYFGKVVARDNLKVAVVGAISPDELAVMLDALFGDLPVNANRTKVADVEPSVGGMIDLPLAIPQTLIRFTGAGLTRDDPDYIPASIAAFILGGGPSSRLYEEIREKRGLAYSFSLSLIPLEHAGLVVAGTSTSADQADQVVAIIENEIARFAEEGPTEAELADAKAFLIGSYPLRFDSSRAIAGQLLGLQLAGLDAGYVDRRNELIDALTIEDVRDAACRLFADKPMTIVRVGQPAS